MKTKPFLIIEVALTLVMVMLAGCLNPIGFNPELKLNVDAKITGAIDTRSSDYAIVWIINRTKSVDVEYLEIRRAALKDEEYKPTIVPDPDKKDENGKMIDMPKPKAGTSFAAYQIPTDLMYSIKLDWKLNGSMDAQYPSPAFGNITQPAQFPRSGYQYKYYLIRDTHGNIRLVDENEITNIPLDSKDVTNPPEPPNDAERQTLVVKNRPSSKTEIKSLELTDSDGTTQLLQLRKNIAEHDSFSFRLAQGDYELNATVSSDQQVKTGSVSIVKDTDPRAATNNNVYLFKNYGGELKFTSRDEDLKDLEDKVGIVDIDVYNDTGKKVVGYKLYHKESNDVLGDNVGLPIPHGVQEHRTSLGGVFVLDIVVEVEKGKVYNSTTYELNAALKDEQYSFRIVDDNNYIDTNKFARVIRPKDFKTTVISNEIDWRISANGGQGDSKNSAYDTTEITIQFDYAVKNLTTIPASSWSTSDGGITWKTSDIPSVTPIQESKPYTVTGATSAVQSGDTVKSGPYLVTIHKHDNTGTPGQKIETHTYVYKESGLIAAQTNKNPLGQSTINESVPFPRNIQHQLDWYFTYEDIKKEDGQEVGRTVSIKTKYGTWDIDASTAGNEAYVLWKNDGTFRIGPRGNPFLANDTKPAQSGYDWKIFTGLNFSNTLPAADTWNGQEAPIENMPYAELPLYLGPFQIGTTKKENYKVVHLVVRN